MKATKIALSALILLATFGLIIFTADLVRQAFRTETDPIQKEFVDRLLEDRPIRVLSEDDAAILLVGDIMLSRNVAAAIARADDPLLPFRDLAGLLASVDVSFGNLESPYSGSNKYPASGSLVFNAPTSTAIGLARSGFRVVSLANNHALDQGAEGLRYTLTHLKEHGILAAGAGETLDEAWTARVVKIRGVEIGFIAASYASVNDGGKRANEFVARIEDVDRLRASVSEAKERADIVIVSMHAGEEYTRQPNQAQIDFARAAIDAGADLVVGSHPHWIQTIEEYRGRYIFYSLGNFIFDQEWSLETKQGLSVKLNIRDRQLEKAELIPVIIEKYCCARLAGATESASILKSINATSTLQLRK